MNFKFLDFFWLIFGLGFVKNHLTLYVGSADSSASSTTNTTNNNDNRMVLGEGASFATMGGTVINQSMDAGVVHDAFAFGTAAINSNVAVTTTAMNDMVKVSSSSFNFANDAMAASLAASQASARQATDAANNALSFAASAQAISSKNQNEAINMAADSMATALSYSSKTTATALDSLSTTGELVSNAYADAKGRGALTDKIMMAAIVGALFVAWKASGK